MLGPLVVIDVRQLYGRQVVTTKVNDVKKITNLTKDSKELRPFSFIIEIIISNIYRDPSCCRLVRQNFVFIADALLWVVENEDGSDENGKNQSSKGVTSESDIEHAASKDAQSEVDNVDETCKPKKKSVLSIKSLSPLLEG